VFQNFASCSMETREKEKVAMDLLTSSSLQQLQSLVHGRSLNSCPRPFEGFIHQGHLKQVILPPRIVKRNLKQYAVLLLP